MSKKIGLSLDWLSFTFEAERCREDYLRVFGKDNQDEICQIQYYVLQHQKHEQD